MALWSPQFFNPYGPAAIKSHNLTSDNADLFTVTGKIAMTLLHGEVTTGSIATTTTYQMRIKTTGEVLFTALTITTDVVATMYMHGGDNTVTMGNGATPITRVGFLDGAGPLSPMIIGLTGGTATIESDLDGAGTGIIKWWLHWWPLEAGANVVAA